MTPRLGGYAAVLGAALVGGAGDATAGKFFDPGTGLGGPVQAASCDRSMARSTDPVPWWSRLTWSLQSGLTLAEDAQGVAVAQLAVAPWLAEWRCASGTGLFHDHLWRRWSLALAGDVMVGQLDATVVVRPSLRLARSHARRGLLSIGTAWTPSSELFVQVGPTLDLGLRGGAVSLGGRASVLTAELRVEVARDGTVTALVLAGFTDLHGLWALGPARSR